MTPEQSLPFIPSQGFEDFSLDNAFERDYNLSWLRQGWRYDTPKAKLGSSHIHL